ncbi:MAG: hypothetical protein ACOYOJ_13600, partial [Alsobacter sp.]
MKATILAALLAGAAWTMGAAPVAAGPWFGRDAAQTGPGLQQGVWFGFEGLSAPEVVDLLYGRYGMARVMRVRPMGDVYEAEAIDRRGFRRHFVVDAYNGRILESFVIGRQPYETAVPQPPGLIPGHGRNAMLPPGRLAPERGLAPEYGFPSEREPTPGRRAAPVRPAEPDAAPVRPRPQQARRPDATAPAPAVRAKPLPDLPKPSGVAPVPEKPPETAARPPQSEPLKPVPARPGSRPADAAARPGGDRPAGDRPAVTPVPVTPPVAAPAPLPPPLAVETPAQVRPAAPVARAPEPLIDPKTGAPLGRPGTTIPVAPLDDAVKVSPPSTPV